MNIFKFRGCRHDQGGGDSALWEQAGIGGGGGYPLKPDLEAAGLTGRFPQIKNETICENLRNLRIKKTSSRATPNNAEQYRDRTRSILNYSVLSEVKRSLLRRDKFEVLHSTGKHITFLGIIISKISQMRPLHEILKVAEI